MNCRRNIITAIFEYGFNYLFGIIRLSATLFYIAKLISYWCWFTSSLVSRVMWKSLTIMVGCLTKTKLRLFWCKDSCSRLREEAATSFVHFGLNFIYVNSSSLRSINPMWRNYSITINIMIFYIYFTNNWLELVHASFINT